MEAEIFGDGQQPGDELPEEFKTMSTEDIQRRWGLWAGLERRQWPRAASGAPPPPPPAAAAAHVAGLLCPSSLGRTRLLENEIRVLRDESNRLTHEKAGMAERVKVGRMGAPGLHCQWRLGDRLPGGCLAVQCSLTHCSRAVLWVIMCRISPVPSGCSL